MDKNKSLKLITMITSIIIGSGLSACNIGAQNLQQPQNNNLSTQKAVHQQFMNSESLESVIYNFGANPKDGKFPRTSLMLGNDGDFYGTTNSGGTNNLGIIFKVTPSGQETVLYTFGNNPNDGSNPMASLIQGNDSDFYGTTQSGGIEGVGTIFKVTPNGQETILYSFGNNLNDGCNPEASLTQGTDGSFYGTTNSGGTKNQGTIFKVTPSGQETILYSFGNNPNDGYNPEASLIQGTDDSFYGTTFAGGANNMGTIFKVTPNGQETVLYTFGNNPNDGGNPMAGLTQGTDGDFYGTTFGGGTNDFGTIFKVTPNGQETVLYTFGNPNDGFNPVASLIQGTDGDFYGTTLYDGPLYSGTAFKITPGGQETVLYRFGSWLNDGAKPWAGLIQGTDGDFYGTTQSGGVYGNGAVFHLKLLDYRVLYTFGTNPNDGSNGLGTTSLIQGNDGDFYGTTQSGGIEGAGTIFKVTPNGQETILYGFGANPNDGTNPVGLTLGADGNFYGTTNGGGTNNLGTIFKVTSSGQETILYSFNDGIYLPSSLIQGTDGDFYGTTASGDINNHNQGTIFKVTPSGQETVLYSFGANPNDGTFPEASLIQGTDGDFYGTTDKGGVNNRGTIFKVTPSGQETILYSFGNSPNDGIYLPSSLIQGIDGNFYGTTQYGGTNNLGTIFKVTPSGQETVLYIFGTNPNDGKFPDAGLTQGADGNFYGTSQYGGINNLGTIFEVTPSGQETILYTFPNPNYGVKPAIGLIQGTDGSFYGIAGSGGINNMGTIYNLVK